MCLANIDNPFLAQLVDQVIKFTEFAYLYTRWPLVQMHPDAVYRFGGSLVYYSSFFKVEKGVFTIVRESVDNGFRLFD